MSHADKQYHEVLTELVKSSLHAEGRNGGVTTHFGKQLVFESVGDYFPLLTTKRLHFKSILVELLWFLKGDTNIKYLNDNGVRIWDEWADKNGELGPVYGKQWRKWVAWNGFKKTNVEGGTKYTPQLNHVDQITNVIKSIKEQPFGRRHIVSAWNPAEVDNMALPPCHTMFQFHVRPTGELDVQLYQRSADWFLGVPFNIASYALLLILVAREVGRTPGRFIHTFGNYHLYDNHQEAAKLQLERNTSEYNSPYIFIDASDDVGIFDLEPQHIKLINYASFDSIKAEVSV